MAGSIVKGDLDVSRAVIAIRANESLRVIAGTSNVSLLGTDGKYINNTATAAIQVTLPIANVDPVEPGFAYYIMNNSTGTTTVLMNGGVSLGTIPVGNTALVVNLTNGDAAGTWEFINLDLDTSGVSKTSITFNATTSWGTAVAGEYTMTLTSTQTNSGNTPEYSVYEDVTDGVDKIDGIDTFVSTATGTEGSIVIKVNETPDERFAGRIVVL